MLSFDDRVPLEGAHKRNPPPTLIPPTQPSRSTNTTNPFRVIVGFKNVSLGNVLAASMAQKSITFLRDDNGDEALYKGAYVRCRVGW